MAEPEFTDTSRDALLWVLWHHQGGSSPVGQAVRFALGMGQFDRLTSEQVQRAKAWAPGIPGLAHMPAGVPACPDAQYYRFRTWAEEEGRDIANSFDTERSRWVFFNPMTADLWAAWQAAAGVMGTVNPACGVHGPIPCEGAGCTCGVAGTPSGMSEFIRNATPERKAEVFGKVMDKVAAQQQAVIDGVTPSDGAKHG